MHTIRTFNNSTYMGSQSTIWDFWPEKKVFLYPLAKVASSPTVEMVDLLPWVWFFSGLHTHILDGLRKEIVRISKMDIENNVADLRRYTDFSTCYRGERRVRSQYLQPSDEIAYVCMYVVCIVYTHHKVLDFVWKVCLVVMRRLCQQGSEGSSRGHARSFLEH